MKYAYSEDKYFDFWVFIRQSPSNNRLRKSSNKEMVDKWYLKHQVDKRHVSNFKDQSPKEASKQLYVTFFNICWMAWMTFVSFINEERTSMDHCKKTPKERLVSKLLLYVFISRVQYKESSWFLTKYRFINTHVFTKTTKKQSKSELSKIIQDDLNDDLEKMIAVSSAASTRPCNIHASLLSEVLKIAAHTYSIVMHICPFINNYQVCKSDVRQEMVCCLLACGSSRPSMHFKNPFAYINTHYNTWMPKVVNFMAHMHSITPETRQKLRARLRGNVSTLLDFPDPKNQKAGLVGDLPKCSRLNN